jgi:HAD superfamily hydrolase (TIGR01458 family)
MSDLSGRSSKSEARSEWAVKIISQKKFRTYASERRFEKMTDDFKGVLFDVDGVLEFKGCVYPGAIELVHALRQKGVIIRILTNSTLKSRKSCAEKLNQMGFEISEQEVVTASYATAKYLKSLNPKSCWVMLKREGLAEFKHFVHDDQNPEYIVLGDYREDFRFEMMNKALKLLLSGSKLIVMITEKVDRSMGDVELTVGAYGKMLEDAAGIHATWIGKPNKYVFDVALETMGIQEHQVLMVGDRITSDVLGAKTAGIKSVLIKSGEFQESDLSGDVQPDYVVESIKEVSRFFR